MAIFSISDKIPSVAESAYVDEAATVTADVTLGENVSVWPGASIRGDEAPIVVDSGSNIQDCAVLHTDPGKPCRVGFYQAVLPGERRVPRALCEGMLPALLYRRRAC